MDYVYLKSIESVENDFFEFYNQLLNTKYDENIWENFVKLGNELYKLKQSIQSNGKTLAFEVRINKYFDSLICLFAINDTTASYIKSEPNIQKTKLEIIKRKFKRCVKNHNMHYLNN